MGKILKLVQIRCNRIYLPKSVQLAQEKLILIFVETSKDSCTKFLPIQNTALVLKCLKLGCSRAIEIQGSKPSLQVLSH